MRLIYDPEARVELVDVYRYYEGCKSGLGAAFLDEIERIVTNIQERPLRWRKITGRFRRALVNRFPYGIIYAVRGDEIYVIAVMHLHRKPGYWKVRRSAQPG